MQPCDVTRLVVALDPEAHVREIFLEHYGLRGREAICFQDHVKFVLLVLSEQAVQAPPHAVLWDHLKACRSFSPVAPKAEPTEDRVVRNDRRRRAERTAVAQVDFAGVVPGPSVVRLI